MTSAAELSSAMVSVWASNMAPNTPASIAGWMDTVATEMRRWSIPSLTGVDWALLAAMPPLLLLLAFFSFVETTYFALTPAERLSLRRLSPTASTSVDRLLLSPRALLVSTMLGALVASTAYFVVSSVLVTRHEQSLAFSVGIALVSLFGMVLSAEVLPKLVGNADRVRAARIAIVPTTVFAAALRPVSEAIDRFVIAPFGRLVGGATPAGVVDASELAALLAQSAHEGAIDVREREAIEGVMRLRRLRVRDVMTPRVDMAWIDHAMNDAEVLALATRRRLTHLPVVDDSVDRVRGILDLKRWMLSARKVSRSECVSPARFVPELATLEQLLEHFRKTESKLAIAVDEYGGTAGIVALEDCVEEIVGDIVAHGERSVDAPTEVAPGCWRVSGEMGISRWSDIFGARVVSPRASTVAGLVLQQLSRLARVGDRVQIANLRLEVESVEGARIRSVLVSLAEQIHRAESAQ
jgi:putative hemolysin